MSTAGRLHSVTTFMRYFVKALGRSLLLAGLMLSVVFMPLAPREGVVAPAPESQVPFTDSDALMAEHDCWTGEAPADVTIPGGVVMRVGTQSPRFYGSDRAVGRALDHIFDGADNGVITVYGFCR